LQHHATFGSLQKADGDIVLIATPGPMHARPQAIAALDAGYHVLSEVPAAGTIDECDALV